MNSKIELEQGIIKMTTSIWKNYPELAKYITEMPIHIPENESVNMKNLQDYYNSLEKLNSEYSKTHKTAKDQIDSEKSIYSDLHLYPKSEDIYEKFKGAFFNERAIAIARLYHKIMLLEGHRPRISNEQHQELQEKKLDQLRANIDQLMNKS